MKENIQTSQAKLVQGVQSSRVQFPSSLTPNPSSGKSPSSLNPHPFTFGPSVQVDLFGYLKPHQQAIMRPYLRLIKRPYQQKLCISLLDYLEGHGLETFSEPILAMLQEEIVQACNLHPLTSSKGLGVRDQGLGKNSLNSQPSSLILHQPKSIGTIIKQLFA